MANGNNLQQRVKESLGVNRGDQNNSLKARVERSLGVRGQRQQQRLQRQQKAERLVQTPAEQVLGPNPTQPNLQDADFEFAVTPDQKKQQQSQETARSTAQSTTAQASASEGAISLKDVGVGLTQGTVNYLGEVGENINPRDFDEIESGDKGQQAVSDFTQSFAQEIGKGFGDVGAGVADTIVPGFDSKEAVQSEIGKDFYGEQTEDLGLVRSGQEIAGVFSDARRGGETSGLERVGFGILGAGMAGLDAVPGLGLSDEASKFALKGGDEAAAGLRQAAQRSSDQVAQTTNKADIQDVLQRNTPSSVNVPEDDVSRVADELVNTNTPAGVAQKAKQFEEVTRLNKVQDELAGEAEKKVDELKKADTPDQVTSALTDDSPISTLVKDDLVENAAGTIARQTDTSEVADSLGDIMLRSTTQSPSGLSTRFLDDAITQGEAEQQLNSIENQITSQLRDGGVDEPRQAINSVKSQFDEAVEDGGRPDFVSADVSDETLQSVADTEGIQYSRQLDEDQKQVVNDIMDEVDRRTGIDTQPIRDQANEIFSKQIDETQTPDNTQPVDPDVQAGQKSQILNDEFADLPELPDQQTLQSGIADKTPGKTPEEYVNELSEEYRNLWENNFTDDVKQFEDVNKPWTLKGEDEFEGYEKLRKKFDENWKQLREFIEDQRIREKKLMRDDSVRVNEMNNSYVAEKIFHGRSRARVANALQFVEGIDQRIVDAANTFDTTADDFEQTVNDYLQAKHAPERNSVHGDGAAGLTNNEAEEIVHNVEESDMADEVKDVAQDIRKLDDMTLDVLHNGEVIGDDLFETLRNAYDEHVPLYRILDEKETGNPDSLAAGMEVKGTGIRQAVGSKRDVDNIYRNVVDNFRNAIRRAEKNRVNLSVKQFAEENEQLDLFRMLDEAEGQERMARNDDNVLTLRENGTPKYIEITDDSMATAMKNLNHTENGAVVRWVGSITRWMSSMATRFAPGFALSNKVRDLQEMATYMAAKKEGGYSGAFKAAGKDVTSMKHVTDWVRGKGSQGARLYEQMRLDGGTTGGLGLSTRADIDVDMDKIRKLSRSNVKKASENVVRGFDNWNRIFEDSTRLSAYRTALENGASRKRAAFIAKNASVDFNKKGTGGEAINAFYMFANAGIQGSRKTLHAMKDPKAAAGTAATVGGATFAANRWNSQVDPNWRNKVSEWDRKSALPIMIPGTDGAYVSIPVAWGIKPMKAAADEAYDMAFSDEDTNVTKSSGKMLTSLLNAYNPVGGNDLVGAALPSIYDIPVQAARNKAWHGGKIYPEWNQKAPPHIQYFDDMEEDFLGRQMIGLTKGLSHAGIEINPAQLKYGIEQITSQAGQTVSDSINTIRDVSDGEVRAEEAPIINRFLQNRSKEAEGFQSEAYKRAEEALAEEEVMKDKIQDEAEAAYQQMKAVDKEERRKIYEQLQKQNPQVADKVKQVYREDQKGLTATQRKVQQMGVENGTRATYIYQELKNKQTPEQRRAMWKEYREKGIISDQVQEQLNMIVANGGLPESENNK
jgi:hypothetical protein